MKTLKLDYQPKDEMMIHLAEKLLKYFGAWGRASVFEAGRLFQNFRLKIIQTSASIELLRYSLDIHFSRDLYIMKYGIKKTAVNKLIRWG